MPQSERLNELIDRARKFASRMTPDQRRDLRAVQIIRTNVSEWIAYIREPGDNTAITVEVGQTFEQAWAREAAEARANLKLLLHILESAAVISSDLLSDSPLAASISVLKPADRERLRVEIQKALDENPGAGQ